MLLKWMLAAAGFGLVAFGQPAWSVFCSIAASTIGYALFWSVLLDVPKAKDRFFLGFLWFSLVQLVQLSWAVSHPYAYIYAVWLFYACGVGAQFGLLSLLITSERVRQLKGVFAIAGVWTLMEWTRLFFLSGYSWNPVGLSLTATLTTLQFASLSGIFGLTFWVILTNLFALRALKGKSVWLWIGASAVPFLYGSFQLDLHDKQLASHDASPLRAVLVQTAFPVEEVMGFESREKLIAYVFEEWREILKATKNQLGKEVDLVALPECVVPFGTYTYLFDHREVKKAFSETYGTSFLEKLPSAEPPFGQNGKVNNAYWTQAIANCFNAGVVCGLEDCDDISPETREYYSSAIYFRPQEPEKPFEALRYEKQILVPMGEYIPFSFCRKLCESYGIRGSFTQGKEAKVWSVNEKPFGVSICYEETFGDLMRENRVKGAQFLLNLTSDVWYPNSRLPRQHWDHSKLRTVEMGIPLVRACNTGITGALDSVGRPVDTLGTENGEAEWVRDSLYVEVPTYHYSTLYTLFGDRLAIGLSFFAAFFLWPVRRR